MDVCPTLSRGWVSRGCHGQSQHSSHPTHGAPAPGCCSPELPGAAGGCSGCGGRAGWGEAVRRGVVRCGVVRCWAVRRPQEGAGGASRNRGSAQKMSAGRRVPARWWWWVPTLLWGSVGGYVVVSSVSWPLPEAGAAADELHSSSTEEALPSLLEEAGGLWKQSYPASAYREDAALGSGTAGRRPGQGATPSRMFSYRREGGGAPGRAGTARFLARYNTWGFVATRAAHGKLHGVPYGNCLLLSDGPVNNSTGIPFFYVTPKDNTVADLLKNPMASLTLPEADGNFCRKNVIDPEDPRCTRLTLMGQMVTVPPEEVEFAKQAMFSRHPVVRKWPRSYEWFFMKMNIEHIWLQSWYGEVSAIAVEEYLKAVPSKG